MPQLICELCVNKVDDFYEFLEMCRQTNKRTRLRLGLPPQAMPRGASDDGDCILVVTEPEFINEDSNEISLRSRNTYKNKKGDSNETSDDGDCILGVTEPEFINEDSNEISLRSRNTYKNKKGDSNETVRIICDNLL
ncbi:uncharacterized protein LOC124542262 [Vanessa cardui]|uniref:uncharacterized protein LOC124542262 n=1 Tax=Vanessa cardui TaxID=171605 RepID=UPI001F1490B9|nr:uncharacterized protein LOC124542262 [Vanessa cardui]